ncbi:hypothetical protein G7074_05510 [Pedobacter sp. HDW13]|uniref:hypothetical protein n=1 Tax=unclassified Pedobacter TaxID=2628915 RepID=UPI000F5ABF16|nr:MULTISPECIES: hypothetical protein [unclassified Pedobacter]QIL38785.1 hypothetical protein G7074_05510 [Pedobacter sp. HDW13]RQO80048.1 hypothetical protein DBR40_00040 [Pedobacter sp. KBW01]
MYKKYIFLALTLLSIAFFYKGVPLDVFHAHTTILTLVGGILSTILLTITFFNFYPPKAVKAEDKKQDNFGCILIVVIVIFFFGFSGFLIFNTVNESSLEIEKNGKYTVGEIVNGSSFKTRKADFTSVIIRYKTQDGKVYQTAQDISAEEFENYYRYQEVPIVYSSKYPTILQILRSDTDIAKYLKIKIRDISISDLEKLIELKNPSEINQYLNSINQKWQYEGAYNGNSYVYNNKFKKNIIKVTPGKELVYALNDVNYELFEDELNKSDFKKNDNYEGKGTVYIKPGYILNKRIERVKTNDPEKSVLDFEQKTVVYFLKTNN